MNDRASQRITSLDGLRGVAALVVVFNHLLLLVPMLAALTYGRPDQSNVIADALTFTPLHLLWAGPESVLIFFVLSGLVLTLPVLHAPTFSWAAYYPARLIRLYVPVVASVLLAFLLATLIDRRSDPGFSVWLEIHDQPYTVATAAQDAFLLNGTSLMNSPLWSLRYELLFSLLLPAYVWLVRRLARFWPLLLIATLAFAYAGRTISDESLRYLPIFALGVLLAVKLNELRELTASLTARRVTRRWGLTLALFASVALVAPWYFGPAATPMRMWEALYPLTLLAAVAFVVLAAFWAPMTSVLNTSVAQWLGRISFSLYLVHEPILVSLGQLIAPTRLSEVALVAAVGLPVSIVVAWLVCRFVEKPSHRLARASARRIEAWTRHRRALASR